MGIITIGIDQNGPSGHPEDDPLFAAQKNKKQRHWKAELRSLDELSAFDAIVLEAIK